MDKEQVKDLITKEGLTIEMVIDAIIELNGFVGVGVVSFADNLRQYILNTLKKN